MNARVAIPRPSSDPEYNQRSLQPYLDALTASGAEPILIEVDATPSAVAGELAGTHAVLLPGSRFDIDPERFGEARIAACGPSDPARTAVDELLLQDAFNLRKPILGICHGAQGLNVWRNGSLYQDLPSQTHTPVDHSPGRTVTRAHPVHIAPGSRLAALIPGDEDLLPAADGRHTQWVNSSHHQAIRAVGDNLRVTAISPDDGVVEAVELDAPDHFVIAVQWHPERTYASSPFSRAIFGAFIEAARSWKPRGTQVVCG